MKINHGEHKEHGDFKQYNLNLTVFRGL